MVERWNGGTTRHSTVPSTSAVPSRLPALLRCTAALGVAVPRATNVAALARRPMILRAPAPGAGLLSTVRLGVDRRPRTTRGFVLRDTAIFVSLLDVLGLAFLFVGVCALVALWHDRASSSSKMKRALVGGGSVRTARADRVVNRRDSSAPLTVLNAVVILGNPPPATTPQ